MYRNTYQAPTSRFYEPLQSTLDKSMVRNPTLQLHKSRAYQQIGATSRISRRMKSLSPQQASYIKSSTIIPLDKDLVPTDHVWKVRGKEFAAVNIQVREGQPIPASHIRIPPNMRGGHITTETVYQLKPKQPEVGSLTNTRSITNLRTIYPPRVTQILPPPRVSQIITPRASEIIRPVASSVDVRRTAAPVRISQAPSIPPANQYQIQPIRPISTSIVAHSTMNKPEELTNAYSDNYQKTQNVYDLNRETTTIKKEKYKYNFFSALDQAVNTKCGSCGANQIIASKPLSSWE